MKMKTQTIWFIICLMFAFQSLEILFEESYEVIYTKSNRTKPVQFLACEKLSDLYPNETAIDLEKLRGDLNKRLQSFLFEWKKTNQSELNEFIWNQTKTGLYLILNEMVCLIAKDEEQLVKLYWIWDTSPSTIITYFAISRDTFDLVKMPKWHDAIEQLTVLKKGHPYSNCRESNARFRCLNECFKSRFRLARYCYDGNETGLIRLNYSHRNRTIAESERICFGQCKRENCKLVQLSSVDVHKQSKVEAFEARLKLSAFDYWVQLVGLLCSFTGLSLNEFSSLAIEFAQSKMKRKKVRIALFGLKLAILLLALASFGYLCTRLALDQKATEDNPKEKEGTRYLIQPKTIHLAICVHINHYINFSYEEKTMWEIERATEGALDDVLEGIYLDYQGRSFRSDYHVLPKKLFRYKFRCFSLSIHLMYQTMTSSPLLRITFKAGGHFPLLYVLTENENLSQQSFWHFGFFTLRKRMVKRMKSNGCVNYEEKYVNCTGRQNCVERCINRKFMNRYKRTTFGSRDHRQTVDKDWFSATEWSTFRPMKFRYDNQSLYEPIRQRCLEEIADEKPCNEEWFEEAAEISKLDEETAEIFIDLKFDVIQSSEEEPSWYKLAPNILSIESILFGLTVLSILQMIAFFVQTILRVRTKKLVLFLVYLLCSFGAIWHTYHILHLMVSGELVSTEHYELIQQIEMPDMVFCLPIDEKLIDRNHQLTGNYLEELTGNITTKSTFKSIAYLNRSNEWIAFDLSHVERFFLFNMKCFRMQIDQWYDGDQFHFSTKRQMLKVNFIKNFIKTADEEKNFVHFMTKSKGTAKFSKIVILKSSTRSLIIQETSLYEYADRFSFIRKHFHSLQEEEVGDLHEQLIELQDNEHCLTTLNLPLEEEAFGMEVDEDLFEQLYRSSVKNRNRRTDLNYQQTFVDNHLREDKRFEADFAFNVVFVQKVVSSTNEENLGQLILGLLNVLFIWFDLGVLDLHSVFAHCHLLVYIYLHLPAFICRRLKKFKSLLDEQLNSLQPSSACRKPARRVRSRF